MIQNKYPGTCSCGKFVPPGQGYVRNRRIVCEEHGAIAAEADHEDREMARGNYADDPIYGWDD